MLCGCAENTKKDIRSPLINDESFTNFTPTIVTKNLLNISNKKEIL